jgi:hypothetical protein
MRTIVTPISRLQQGPAFGRVWRAVVAWLRTPGAAWDVWL